MLSGPDLPIHAAGKKSIANLTEKDLKGKRVFVRADLNVPLDKKTGACRPWHSRSVSAPDPCAL